MNNSSFVMGLGAIAQGVSSYNKEKERLSDKRAMQRQLKEEQIAKAKSRQLSDSVNGLRLQQMEMTVNDMKLKERTAKVDSIFKGWLATNNPDLINGALEADPSLRVHFGDGNKFRTLNDGDLSKLAKEGKNSMYIKNHLKDYVAVEVVNPETQGLMTKYVDMNSVIIGSGYYRRDLIAKSKLQGGAKKSEWDMYQETMNTPADQVTRGALARAKLFEQSKLKNQPKPTFYGRFGELSAKTNKTVAESEELKAMQSKVQATESADPQKRDAGIAEVANAEYAPRFKDWKSIKEGDIRGYIAQMGSIKDKSVRQMQNNLMLHNTAGSYKDNIKKGSPFDKKQIQILDAMTVVSEKHLPPARVAKTEGAMSLIKQGVSLSKELDGIRETKTAGIFSGLREKLIGKMNGKDWNSLDLKTKKSILTEAGISSKMNSLVKKVISLYSGQAASDNEVDKVYGIMVGEEASVIPLMRQHLNSWISAERGALESDIEMMYNSNPLEGALYHNALTDIKAPTAEVATPATGEKTLVAKTIEAGHTTGDVANTVGEVASDVKAIGEKLVSQGSAVVSQGSAVVKEMVKDYTPLANQTLDSLQKQVDTNGQKAYALIQGEGKEAIQQGIDIASKQLAELSNTASSMGSEAVSQVEGAKQSLQDLIAEGQKKLGSAVDTVNSAVDGAKEAVANAVDTTVDTANSAVDGAKEAVANVDSKVGGELNTVAGIDNSLNTANYTADTEGMVDVTKGQEPIKVSPDTVQVLSDTVDVKEAVDFAHQNASKIEESDPKYIQGLRNINNRLTTTTKAIYDEVISGKKESLTKFDDEVTRLKQMKANMGAKGKAHLDTVINKINKLKAYTMDKIGEAKQKATASKNKAERVVKRYMPYSSIRGKGVGKARTQMADYSKWVGKTIHTANKAELTSTVSDLEKYAVEMETLSKDKTITKREQAQYKHMAQRTRRLRTVVRKQLRKVKK